MPATIIKFKNANFAGQGLPNINPFVAQSEAEFAFDFRNRSDRLLDLVGKHTLTPHRHDIAGAVTYTPDPTVVTTTADGLGINVELGYLLTSKSLATIPIDGSVKFSVLVVGGFSGIPFPAGKVAGANASNAILFDGGSRVTPSGFAIEDSSSSSALNTVRIKSGGSVMSATKSGNTKKTLSILTFDGLQWTWQNKTTGSVITKTNAELGISGPIAVITDSNVSKMTVGHCHSASTIHAAYPAMYQLAYWNRVLTQAEIDEQYVRSKANFAALGL